MLTQLLGCSYAEAAAICGCPVGTIRSRVARAREDLDAMTADPDAAPRPESANGTAADGGPRSYARCRSPAIRVPVPRHIAPGYPAPPFNANTPGGFT